MRITFKQNTASIMFRYLMGLIVGIVVLLGLVITAVVANQSLDIADYSSYEIVQSLKKSEIDGDDDWKVWKENSTLDTYTTYLHVTNMRADAKRKSYYSPNADDVLYVKLVKVWGIANLYYRPDFGFLYHAAGHAKGINYEIWMNLDDQFDTLVRVLEVTLVVMVLAAIIGAFFARFLARKLTNNLVHLTNDVQNVTATGSDVLVQLPVPDKPVEVAKLATDFNTLLAQVHKQTEVEKAFVANAAHELRTPIATIRSHAQLIMRRGEEHPEVIPKSVEYINAVSYQMQTLVNELLTLSKIDRQEFTLTAVPVAEVVQQAVYALGPEIDAKVQTAIAADLTVCTNRDALRQILSIVVTNAHKYSPAEAPIIIAASAAAGAITLRVTDNGRGISAADKEHVFDRFYRGAEFRGNTEGTGLGLSIAKQLAQLTKIEIVVLDNPSGGTIFEMTFAETAE